MLFNADTHYRCHYYCKYHLYLYRFNNSSAISSYRSYSYIAGLKISADMSLYRLYIITAVFTLLTHKNIHYLFLSLRRCILVAEPPENTTLISSPISIYSPGFNVSLSILFTSMFPFLKSVICIRNIPIYGFLYSCNSMNIVNPFSYVIKCNFLY